MICGEVYDAAGEPSNALQAICERIVGDWREMGMELCEVCVCDVCGHRWIPESERKPVRCPSKRCRSVRWDSGRTTVKTCVEDARRVSSETKKAEVIASADEW